MSAPPVATTWTLLMFGPPSSSCDVQPEVPVVALVDRRVVARELRLGDPLELELDRRQRGQRRRRPTRRRRSSCTPQRAGPPRSRWPASSETVSCRSLLLTRRRPTPPATTPSHSLTQDGRPPASMPHRAVSRAAYHGMASRSSATAARYSTIPRTQARTIAAHADGYCWPGLERDVDPERVQRPAEELPDDGADDAQRRRDPAAR